MNDIEVSSIDLVEGGNVFKQGHYLTLGYVPRDEKGETVDLSGKTLNVALWGRKGVVFESAATYSGGVIRFTFDKMVAAGDYTVEFTATSSTDAKYRKKFPTNQHSGRIAIKQSADDLGVVGIQVYTVAQLKAEQKALLDAAVSGFTVDSETKMARVSDGTTYASLPARLEADKQETAAQLAETLKKTDTGILDLNVFNEDSRNILQGQEPGTINAVLGEGNVQPENLSPALQNIALFRAKNQLPSIVDIPKWSKTFADLSLSGSDLLVTATGGSSNQTYGRIYAPLTDLPAVGNKFFIRIRATLLNSAATAIRIILRDGTGGTILSDQRPVPQMNVETDVFYNVPVTSAIVNTGVYLFIDHMYADAPTAIGKQMKISAALATNLTVLYGAGNEPTATDFKNKLVKSNSLDLYSAQNTLTRLEQLEEFEEQQEFETTDNTNSSLLQVVKSSDGEETYNSYDAYKYPLSKSWGNEYLYSWYKRIADNENVIMSYAGDSTTENTELAENFKRHMLGKKILTLGGYDPLKVTSLNKGHGENTSEDWLETWLDEDMAENPHLYVIGYGLNDGGNNYYPGTTIQQRVDGFEQRLREGLSRIRTAGTYASGASYNRDANQLAIIISMPVSTHNPLRQRTPVEWHNYIRPVIQKACRDFQCGFVDPAAHQYDHAFNSTWSRSGDGIHPDYVSASDYMSVFSDILMPYCFRN